MTYQRFLTDSFGDQSSLSLDTGAFRAPVEGVYLVNFDSHFDTGRGPTTSGNEYRVVLRLYYYQNPNTTITQSRLVLTQLLLLNHHLTTPPTGTLLLPERKVFYKRGRRK